MKNALLSLIFTATITCIAFFALTPDRQSASTGANPCTSVLSVDMRDLPVAPAAFNHNPYVQTIR